MVLEKQFISADMFLEYVQQIDDRIVELVEGVIVDMSRPSWEHGEILSLIHARVAGRMSSSMDLVVLQSAIPESSCLSAGTMAKTLYVASGGRSRSGIYITR